MSYTPSKHRSMKVEDWSVSPELAEYTGSKFAGVNLPRALDRFRNHHRGRATRSQSFDALFLNWLEQDADRIGEKREGGTDYKGIPNDSAQAWANHLMGRTPPPNGGQR